VRVNERLCAMTGFTREELLSKTVAEITHPDDRERDREFIHALKSGRLERWSTEKRYVHRSGDPVWVLVNGTIVRGLDGDSDHLIAHAADITDRRRADDALREASHLKDEFLATLSHELRTPLNVVVGWTHILTRETNCPTHVRRSLAVIARNADALRRLTDDLIGLSSVLTGRVRLEDQRVDLRAVIDDAVDSVSLAAHAKGLSILKETGGRPIVRGDEARLRQVFWNLLSNAVKFTSTGGTITVTSQPDGDQIAVRVADTGIGIPESFLPYVFDKFRQEDASHTRRHQGLGLGLTIARQFTELHGGTIAVQSPGRNQGTIFTVTLPAADGPAAPAFEPGAPARYGFARRGTSHADPIEAEVCASGEAAGEVTDDERLHDEGVADEVTGQKQETLGRSRRKVGEAIEDLGDRIER
jgi:PAS domain S-box-containing protein